MRSKKAGRKGKGKTNANGLIAHEKAVVATKLRLGGAKYQEIANHMGISVAYAYQLVRRELDDYKNQAQENVEQIREMELSRLDELFKTFYAKARDGDDKAADTCMKIMAQRRKYYADLEAPKELMLTGDPNRPIHISHEEKAIPIQSMQHLGSDSLEAIEMELNPEFGTYESKDDDERNNK